MSDHPDLVEPPGPPLVSVVVPVFNRVQYIADCIQSALTQDYPNLEVIVSDNASTDGSWEVCESITARDGRVRLFRNHKNLGPVANWERGIAESRGAYCKLLFSDDLLRPGCIRQLAEAMTDESGLVICNVLLGTSLGNAKPFYGPWKSGRLSSHDYVRRVARWEFPVSPGAALFRTCDLAASLRQPVPASSTQGFEKHGAGIDVLTMLRVAEKYPSVEIVDQPGVFFRTHNDSITVQNRDNAVFEGYTAAIAGYLGLIGRPAEERRFLCRQWLVGCWKSRRYLSLSGFISRYRSEGARYSNWEVGQFSPFVACAVIASLIRRRLRRWGMRGAKRSVAEPHGGAWS